MSRQRESTIILQTILSLTNDDDGDFDVMILRTVINEREDDSRSLLAAAAAAASSCSSCREQLQGAVTNFYSHVVRRFSPDTFKSHFRMNRTTFEVSKVYAFHTFSGVYREVMSIITFTLTVLRQVFKRAQKNSLCRDRRLHWYNPKLYPNPQSNRWWPFYIRHPKSPLDTNVIWDFCLG